MSSVLISKRGSVYDAVFIALVMLVVMMMLPIVLYWFTATNDGINNQVTLPADAAAANSTFADRFPTIIQTVYLVILFGSYLLTFILAFLIDSRPIFFVIAALIFTAFSAIIPFMINAAETVFDQAIFATAVSNLPILSFLLANYFVLSLGMWVIVAIALYAKRQTQ